MTSTPPLLAKDWIAHHARYQPGRIAMVDLASERTFTYADMNRRVQAAAAWLHGLGVRPGERVAVLSHNDTDVFELQFACWRLAAIFLPLNWRLVVPELEFICNDAKPRVLVSGAEFADVAGQLQRLCDIPRLALMANGAPSDYEAGIAAADPDFERREPEIGETWTVMYTSGTTGRPKGARITYRMALYNAVNCSMMMELTGSCRGLTFLPTFHTGGLNVYANPLFHFGGRNTVMRSFDAERFADLLADKELALTHAFGVPTNFLMMMEVPAFRTADFSHIFSIGIGGAAAPTAVIEAFSEQGLLLQQGWGMTETGPLGLFLSPDKALEKIGSSGLPAMHIDLRIVDDADRDVAPGETGELLIRGATVTPGYWNRDEANRLAFKDGWFYTGDAARQDEDGYYYIVDRWKDMFISGGENVYPAEVENAIYQLDGVLETAVIGIPHRKWGEVGRAFVVLKDGANLNEEAIIEHCADQLAKYKVPKQVRLTDELPHNATGKVLKHELPRD